MLSISAARRLCSTSAAASKRPTGYLSASIFTPSDGDCETASQSLFQEAYCVFLRRTTARTLPLIQESYEGGNRDALDDLHHSAGALVVRPDHRHHDGRFHSHSI